MTDDRLSNRRTPHRLATAARTTAAVVERVAFWTAVALPLVYVPLFAAGLPDRVPGPVLVLALVTLNVLAVLLGYNHDRQPTT